MPELLSSKKLFLNQARLLEIYRQFKNIAEHPRTLEHIKYLKIFNIQNRNNSRNL
jgi:hypothetical protein